MLLVCCLPLQTTSDMGKMQPYTQQRLVALVINILQNICSFIEAYERT